MVSLVLIGQPDDLHIMLIAVPYSRENCWCVSPGDPEALSRLVGRKASQWVQTNRDRLGIQCIATRNYIPSRQPFTRWMMFPSLGGAEEFLQAFPGWAIADRIERLEQERQDLAGKMEARLARGGFDLGKFPAGERRNIARRFIGADEKLEGLARQIDELRRAESLRAKWEQGIRAHSPEAETRG